MGVEIAIAIAGLALSAKGQRDQRKASKRAGAANERARQAEIRQSKLEQQKERRKQIREARQKRQTAVNVAEAQGAGASTVVPGTTGSVSTQLASNLGFLSQSSANIGSINQALGEKSKALSDASTGAALAGFGGTIFSNAEQLGRFGESVGTIFSGTKNA